MKMIKEGCSAKTKAGRERLKKAGHPVGPLPGDLKDGCC